MSSAPSWMLYGAAGYTGTLITEHARERGHQPLLAGRNAPAITALGERFDLPHQTLALDDPAALHAALTDVDLVLNAAGPFLHTSSPLAEACLRAGAHYLDISNELRVFSTMYDLDERARQADVAIIPGVGFGVVATNCVALHVSDAVGGAMELEVASRAATAQPGPGVAATRQENMVFGGWIRRAGQLEPLELGLETTTITLPDGPYTLMPVPTGDLEAAFQATGAPSVTAYTVIVDPGALDPQASDEENAQPPTHHSFGWARATGSDGATAQALLQTGESYVFTATSSIRAVEEVLAGTRRGALSPAAAFGTNFPLTFPDTSRTDAIAPESPPANAS